MASRLRLTLRLASPLDPMGLRQEIPTQDQRNAAMRLLSDR